MLVTTGGAMQFLEAAQHFEGTLLIRSSGSWTASLESSNWLDDAEPWSSKVLDPEQPKRKSREALDDVDVTIYYIDILYVHSISATPMSHY